MIVTTWNVNSVRARADRVKAYLETRRPDVLCLQETKVDDPAFPREVFAAAGYSVEISGQRTYNGVAIATRTGLVPEDIRRGFDGDGADAERRLIAATVGGLRVIDVYVPNGQEVGAPKYAYKLDWLSRLRAFVAEEAAKHPALVVCGDFNVAPDDRDVHDPELWRGRILCSDAERAALRDVLGVGLGDLHRRFTQDGGVFTWWDYRQLAFPKNHGLRIDLLLATPAAADKCRAVTVDRQERKGKGASDHAPVVATFD